MFLYVVVNNNNKNIKLKTVKPVEIKKDMIQQEGTVKLEKIFKIRAIQASYVCYQKKKKRKKTRNVLSFTHWHALLLQCVYIHVCVYVCVKHS